MVIIPPEALEFLRNHHKKLFFLEGYGWLTLKALRKAVFAGKADDWDVIDIDLDTGTATIVCTYCASGIEHPNDGASSVTPEASGTLH